MNARIEALRARLEEPLLVTNLVNILYLTGFDSSNAALLVDSDGPTSLFTDFRYIEAAEEVEGVEAVMSRRSLVHDLSERLEGRVGFEADALPFSQHALLAAGGAELVPTTGIVEALRAVKDAAEIEKIRHAALVAERAFEALTAETWIGRSEKEIAWRLHQLLHAHGADELAFDMAIACGPNGARPHAAPTDALVEDGTLVVADWGARVDGYCSDCTRTLSTGDPPRKLRHAYDVCLEAQLAAVEGIRPGMTGVEADRVARDVIEREGFGSNFGHGLGHGVGLAVHEAPRLSTESSDTLEVGQVVTIEPGIYLPGVGGVRIEDLAVVRDDGARGTDGLPEGADARQLTCPAVAEVVSTAQFRTGMHIQLDGQTWRIVDFQHVKPGKGGAFVRTKLKAFDTGAVVDRTFRAGEKFERIRTETKEMQYLYDAGDDVVFMDTETYEQLSLPRATVEDALPFMQPSSSWQVVFVDGRAAGIDLPSSVVLEVTDTEPGVKGDTVSNVTKPATLETGAVVQVPLFVNVGDRLKVDPRESRYISRA